MQMAKDGTGIDMAIDAKDLAQRTTLKLVDPEDKETPRTRMISAQYGPNPVDESGNANGTEKNATPPKSEDDSQDGKTKPQQPADKTKTNGKPVAAATKQKTN